jgi:hypothetical protein
MSNPVPLELQAKIASWRLRAADGTLTLEEMREAILHLRAGRVSAQAASATAKRKKAIAEIPKAADLLDELEGLS